MPRFSVSLLSLWSYHEKKEETGERAEQLVLLFIVASVGNIMIEYNYPECTTSVLSALKVFSKKFPDYRSKEIE